MEYQHWVEPTLAQKNTLAAWSVGTSPYLAQKANVINKIKNIGEFREDYYPQGVLPYTEVEEEIKLTPTANHWISLSRNPVLEEFSFWAGDTDSDLPYQIRDVHGKVVAAGTLNGLERIACENWSAGIYFLQIEHPIWGVDVQKVVKQ